MGEGRHGSNLQDFAQLTGWPTPMAGNPGTEDYNPAGSTDSSRRTVALVGWATPTSRDHKDGAAPSVVNSTRTDKLPHQVQLSGWATPTVADADKMTGNPENVVRRMEAKRQIGVVGEATLTHGPTSPGSPAATERPGQLNPDFSLWLMGYPAAWGSCGARAMRSCRKSPRRSSKRTEGSDAA